MPVDVRFVSAALGCVLLVMGCRDSASLCPEASVTADPTEIPPGTSNTNVVVRVNNPSPENGVEVITEVTAASGAIAEPFARQTTFACAHDVSGPVELCVNAIYTEGAGGDGSEVANVECNETRCTTIICPDEKNTCPVVSSLTVEPTVVPEGGTATIRVVADDADGIPEPLLTTLSARYGTIQTLNASESTYTCDPDVGGPIEVCVVASDGDSACDVKRCTTVRCPGEPPENTCPVIRDFTANPTAIPAGDTDTLIVVDASDPDGDRVFTRLNGETGVFEDREASETTFTCGDSGPVELCVDVTDGNPECEETRCITVQCPSTIAPNLCPQLFVLNAVPSVIPPGQTTTSVQTRGQDNDGLPQPLVLTLDALWGSFENTENIPRETNVVAQDATYICDRPGFVELCVVATDGACTKTLCRSVACPDDIPTPP